MQDSQDGKKDDSDESNPSRRIRWGEFEYERYDEGIFSKLLGLVSGHKYFDSDLLGFFFTIMPLGLAGNILLYLSNSEYLDEGVLGFLALGMVMAVIAFLDSIWNPDLMNNKDPDQENSGSSPSS
jgi:hypothetical protein